MRATWPTDSAALRLAGLLMSAGIVAGCAGGDQVRQVAVQPSVDLPDSVALGEPLRFDYTWTPASDFTAPKDDYKVFVHLLDPQGRIVLQDDHYPPEPTSQWVAGEPQHYERWLYPPNLEVESLDVQVGMYTQDQRAQVRDDSGWSDAVTVQHMQVRIEDQTGLPVYMDGWNGQEQVDDSAQGTWRWTEGQARVVFTNPRRDAVLHLRAHAPYDELQGPQTVVLSVEGQEAATFEVASADAFLRRFELPAAALGDKDWVEVAIQVDPVLVPQQLDPSSSDERQLGLQVFQLYLSSS